MDPNVLSALLLLCVLVGFYLLAREFGTLAPVFAASLVAAYLNRPDVAFGIALSAAVASIGLCASLAILQQQPPDEPQTSTSDDPPSGLSLSPLHLLLPAGLAVLFAGLAGSIGPLTISLLLPLGIAILYALRLKLQIPRSTSALPPKHPIRYVLLGLALAVGAVAGWLGVLAVDGLASLHPQASAATLAACVLGPACVMPLLGSTTQLTTQGQTAVALRRSAIHSVTASLLVYPLAAFVLLVRRTYPLLTDPAGTDRASLSDLLSHGIPIPSTLWKVESVLLCLLSALLLTLTSTASSRHKSALPQPLDGLLLLLLYIAYLLLSAVGGTRSI